ncbi:BTAD domain-containing putative transcriptional regulator [Rhodopila sp.]|uniref:BTAD domain-containing putative transcriptional regulator n=1 Tax=Rhodopila sp. TaxID=2480087 RepID=UPI003D0DD13B
MSGLDPGGGATVLRMGLFGPTSFNIGGRELRFKSLKLRAILGYIALNEALTETRERLVGLLWSESGEDHARASLRQNIRELRVAMQDGQRGLHIDVREIGFLPRSIEVDVSAVINAAEAGQVHPLLLERRNLADDLMAGLEDLDPSFRSWLLAKRHTVRDRLLRALENALALEPGDLAAQGKLAQAILNLDPTHEDAARRLMRARAMVGDTGGALRVYKALWDLLDEDYGMEPAEATQKLVADIKTGLLEPAHSNAPASVAATAPAVPMTPPYMQLWLAVQKVAIRDIDPAKAHLVLEFRQHLVGSLLKFREWRVTDAPAEAAGPGPERAGHYQVQMAAYQAGPDLEMMVTLKDLESDYYVWSENFELKLENWFINQRRVVRRIAMGLNVYLSADRLRRFSDRQDVSLGLYDRWLRCQTQVRTFNPHLWQGLKQQFTEIINQAPTFAPAYQGLADLNNMEHIAHPGAFRIPARDRAAFAYAREAVRLDPSDMRAHRCMAWSHSMINQHDQAIMHLDVGYELNPNDSWYAISGASLLAFCGRIDRAADLAVAAMDMTLAPSLTHWAYKAVVDYLAGDYAAAIRAADLSQDVIWDTPAWRAAALTRLGRSAEAQAEGARFLERIRLNWYGTQSPEPEAILKWELHIHPMSRREDWLHLRDGLAGAGLPTASLEHGVW